MTATSADFAGRPEHVQPSADELFQGAATVRSERDLAQAGVFDDTELKDFLADLAEMRRADHA